MRTLRVSDGSDFVNIVDTINRLSGENIYAYWRDDGSSGSYTGLVCSNIAAFKNLEKCSELTSIISKQWKLPIGDSTTKIDFRNTKLKKVLLSGISANVYLPNTVSSLELDVSGLPIFSENTDNLNHMYIQNSNNLDSNFEFFDSLKNVTNLSRLDLVRNANLGFTNLKVFKNTLSSVVYLNLGGTSYSDNSIGSLDGIEYFPNLQLLDLDYTSVKLDVSAFSSSEAIAGVNKSLRTLSLNYANISSISGLENLSNLKSLSLNNNNISNLEPLANLKSLQMLDLSNNVVGDTASYVDTDGTTKTVNNLQILANLNSGAGKGGSLTTLYLAGNSNIVDFKPVSNLKWTAKSGF